MSSIVMLRVALDTPDLIADLLSQLQVINPAMAQFIQSLDPIPLIKECAQNTIDFLASESLTGIKKQDFVSNGRINTSTWDGVPLIGALSHYKFPDGVGVLVMADGAIKFVADDGRDYCGRIDYITRLFKEAFTAQAIKTILEIMDYQVVLNQRLENNTVVASLEGVKL